MAKFLQYSGVVLNVYLRVRVLNKFGYLVERNPDHEVCAVSIVIAERVVRDGADEAVGI